MVAEGYGPSHLLCSIVCEVDSMFSNVRILFGVFILLLKELKYLKV